MRMMFMLLKMKLMMIMLLHPPNPPADNSDGGGHDGEEIDGELNDDHNDNDDKMILHRPNAPADDATKHPVVRFRFTALLSGDDDHSTVKMCMIKVREDMYSDFKCKRFVIYRALLSGDDGAEYSEDVYD